MKFKFCGKLDCPDWILAELFHASHLESQKFGLICEGVRDTIAADGAFNQELMDQLGLDDTTFDIDDARACFAAINFIMTGACLYEVPIHELGAELEQLGLPEEHSILLCSAMDAGGPELKKHLRV